MKTVYWHRLPFVAKRDLPEEQLEKLVRDFGVRYIWSDQQTVGTIRANFPEASVRFDNERYTVFELLDVPP